jgi:hypothetical protein
MRFAKRVFFIAGVYGLIVLAPQYFLEAKTGRDFPPAITHPEYYYGFIGVGLVFQLIFLIIAKDPVRYRAMMVPAILEKATFGIAAVVLFLQGSIPTVILGFAIIDLLLGLLLVVAYANTSKHEGRVG